jgi:predicted dehydrogenase
LLHNGVHGLDLVTWWIGDEPVEIVARGVKVTAPGLALWDYFHVVLRYRHGACATVEFSRTNRPRAALDRGVAVVGPDGILTIPPDAWGGELRAEAVTTPLWFDGQAGFDREVAAWVEAARGGGIPPVTAADGRRAVAMALAAERSIELGVPVGLEA